MFFYMEKSQEPLTYVCLLTFASKFSCNNLRIVLKK